MEQKPLVSTDDTITAVKKMEKGSLIIGGPQQQVYGTLPGMKTLFVWTAKDKAEDFIKDNNLDPNEERVIEEAMETIYAMALRLGFTTLRFDFIAAGRHPDQQFVHCNVKQAVANQGVENLLQIFNSL